MLMAVFYWRGKTGLKPLVSLEPVAATRIMDFRASLEHFKEQDKPFFRCIIHIKLKEQPRAHPHP